MNFFNNFKDIKNKLLQKYNIFYLLIIFFVFFSDRFSKYIVLNKFSDNTYYVNSFINVDLIWNTGIGFGLLSFDSSTFYHFISAVIGLVIVFLLYLCIYSKKSEQISFLLITGGAFGNFYDRIIYNAVPDFIDLHYNNFHWFTFNVADIFITSGIINYLIWSLFKDD